MNKYKIIFESNLSFAEKIETAGRLALHEVDKVINISIKDYVYGKLVWSEFEKEFKDGDKWEIQTTFYYGDLSKVNLEEDWRFKEVKNKRKLAKFKGLSLQDKSHNLKPNHVNVYTKYLSKTD